MENTQSSSKKDNSLDLINIESLNNLINNSYFKESLYIDNTFTVFKSINDILYLIYSNENKSIISYIINNNNSPQLQDKKKEEE